MSDDPKPPEHAADAAPGRFVRFAGTDDYVADPALSAAVEAALALGRPLLVKGEPGTGKTELAEAVAHALARPLLTWHVKSTSKATEGLYVFDVVQRLHDSRFGDADVSDLSRYVRLGALGRAFASEAPSVVLIDEIDKADLEFPNDLLRELDEMAFTIPETGVTIRARHRPFTLITSNAEKDLPDAFLRRCVFHYLAFPEPERMARIVEVHHPALPATLVKAAIDRFFELRALKHLRKLPTTSELLDWLTVLVAAGVPEETVRSAHPFLGVLLKSERDLELVQRGGKPTWR